MPTSSRAVNAKIISARTGQRKRRARRGWRRRDDAKARHKFCASRFAWPEGTDAGSTSAAEGLQNLGFDGVLSSLSFAVERKGAAVGAAQGITDRHTSDIGHWFAMTGFFTRGAVQIHAAGCLHPALRIKLNLCRAGPACPAGSAAQVPSAGRGQPALQKDRRTGMYTGAAICGFTAVRTKAHMEGSPAQGAGSSSGSLEIRVRCSRRKHSSETIRENTSEMG